MYVSEYFLINLTNHFLKRFKELRSYLRFDKVLDRKEDETDKLSPIRFVYEKIIDNFQLNIYFKSIFLFCANLKCLQTFYVCGRNITVDETLINYNGLCGFSHYLQNKQCGKYGIKVRDIFISNWHDKIA